MTITEAIEKIHHSDHPLAKWARNITLFNAFKGAVKWGPVAASVWVWGVPYLEARAGEYLKQELIEQGLDPEKFKGVPDQIEQMSKENLTVQSDLATIKEQNRQALEQNQKLIDLLEKQLQR